MGGRLARWRGALSAGRLWFLMNQDRETFAAVAADAITGSSCAAGFEHRAGSEPESCGGCTQALTDVAIIRGLARGETIWIS